MLDIVQLRKDLDAVVARLNTRKTPQTFLDVEAYRALDRAQARAELRRAYFEPFAAIAEKDLDPKQKNLREDVLALLRER